MGETLVYRYNYIDNTINDLHTLVVKFWIEERYCCRCTEEPGEFKVTFLNKDDAFMVRLKYNTIHDLVRTALGRNQ
jgi:hypothetical protein